MRAQATLLWAARTATGQIWPVIGWMDEGVEATGLGQPIGVELGVEMDDSAPVALRSALMFTTQDPAR
jgi:hypothetical protein